MNEDRPGIPDTDMDVTDGDEALPQTDPNPPEAETAGEADAPAPGDAVQAEPELPEKFVPPERGNPFSLRVDQTEVPIEGARVIDDYIVLPKEVWDRKIQPTYVANREQWIKREQQYKQRIGTLETQTIPEERQKAQAMLAELGGLLDDRTKLIEWLDNFEQNAPLLKQQAETRLLKDKLEKYEREQAETTAARQAEELRPRLQSYLADQVTAAQRELKGLGAQKDLVDRVWKFHAPRLFYEDAQQQIQFDHTLFRELMEDEHRRAQVMTQTTAKVAEVAKRNAAAVGPSRAPDGKYQKVTPPRPAGSKMTAEEWDAEFEKRLS